LVKKLLKTNRNRRLPPLNAVRAFEAAARTGGFQVAGAELNVSANAVGRLVKVLEESLGVTLFKRLSRGVVLTEAGGRYLARVKALLDELAEATADLERSETTKILTVSAGPSIVARWLIPRLGRLVERHDLDVRLVASPSLTDFAHDGVDVAIRYGCGTFDGLRSDLLLREEFFPVCSPSLLARGPRLREPADLSQHVLLHQQYVRLNHERDVRIHDHFGWADWFAAIGITGINGQRDLYFSFSHMVLQAAAEGQGVALASSAYLADDLASGRLIRPFGGGPCVRGARGFYIVCPQATADREKIAAFRNWALEEAAGER
jgi:LysR family transcriptional regulator, glycine cleavage system transcriptional activator